jgi:hypothetical protein
MRKDAAAGLAEKRPATTVYLTVLLVFDAIATIRRVL